MIVYVNSLDPLPQCVRRHLDRSSFSIDRHCLMYLYTKKDRIFIESVIGYAFNTYVLCALQNTNFRLHHLDGAERCLKFHVNLLINKDEIY